MAALAQESGKYDEAEALYKKTLAIRERLLGDSHPELALTLNDFAVRPFTNFTDCNVLTYLCRFCTRDKTNTHKPSLFISVPHPSARRCLACITLITPSRSSTNLFARSIRVT